MISIDSKITIWNRFQIEDEAQEALMKFLEAHPNASFSEILRWASKNDIEGEHSTLDDTGVEMTPEENGGQPTVEVWSYAAFCPDNPGPLWSNAIPEGTLTIARSEPHPYREGITRDVYESL